MLFVSMFEAKSEFSRMVEAIESKREDEIIITRNGRPVVRLVALETTTDTSARIGVAKDAFVIPDEIDDGDVSALFLGTDSRK